ncbi:MAG: asparagine synthase (glutamine-hydrolyzing), partial [Kiritimatiellae bacterium]|nr:asparagine synthase (glutamine-hydrolyzing) [Kiritimatiellia bacterium]
MCGIAGIFGFSNQAPFDPAPVQRAMDAMARRGPDDQGIYQASGIALGHRRLSVIDLQGGRQPFTDAPSGITLVYNGEIYNFHELREILTALGHTFTTHSDTEVLLKAYRQWGVECLHHLNGMFAFALYDPAAQTLFAARDRLGIKPFFHTLSEGRFLFASTLAALLCLSPERPVLNQAAAAHYLSTIRTTLEHQTLVEGVFALLPGEYLLIRRGEPLPKPVRYWSLPLLPPQEKENPPLAEAAREVHALIEDSVRLRLISDVPLGGFLSGGLDSTILAALASRLTEGNYKAYSVGY